MAEGPKRLQLAPQAAGVLQLEHLMRLQGQVAKGRRRLQLAPQADNLLQLAPQADLLHFLQLAPQAEHLHLGVKASLQISKQKTDWQLAPPNLLVAENGCA